MRIAAFIVPALVGVGIGAASVGLGIVGEAPAAAHVAMASAATTQGERPAACPDRLPADTPSLTCGCTAEAVAGGGTAWGTNIYTDDSNICRAARHAGVIGSQGGIVEVREAAGRPSYAGSSQNDIATSNWPNWRRSIVFAGGPTAPPPTASADGCPADATGLSGTTRCACSREMIAEEGIVWGSGPYTADSRVCRAARHAGVIGANGGHVTLRVIAGLPRYRGSVRHGIRTQNWARYDHSFVFVR